MPSITLTLEEYDELRNKRRDAEESAAQLQNELALARTSDHSGSILPLVELTRAALRVVSFAVGNMPPETTRNWPIGDLRMVAALVQQLPDHAAMDASFAIELQSFANEVDRIERLRKAG